MDLRRGSLIMVRAFGGKEIIRRFVRKHKGLFLICSDEEYRLAARQHREPICVGFRVDDVIAAVSPKDVTSISDSGPRTRAGRSRVGRK